MKLLTIGILTYNRELALNRLLKSLVLEIEKNKISKYINILISDNSEENTKINKKIIKKKYIFYTKNKNNLGQDGNTLNLYDKSKSKYLLFFGDDDIVYKNSLKKLIFLLNNQLKNAELVICSHKQGDNVLPFRNNIEYKELSSDNLSVIASVILQNAKMSNILIKKTVNGDVMRRILKKYLGTLYVHQIIALEILKKSFRKKIYQLNFFTSFSIMSEVKNLRLPTTAFSTNSGVSVLSHSFFKDLNNLESIKKEYLKNLKKTEVMIHFYALSYIWRVENINEYYDNIKLLKFDKILMSLNSIYIIIFFITKYNLLILSLLRFFNKKKNYISF